MNYTDTCLSMGASGLVRDEEGKDRRKHSAILRFLSDVYLYMDGALGSIAG